MARRDTAARRYAEAAFEIGRADRTLEAWERDLLELRDALAAMSSARSSSTRPSPTPTRSASSAESSVTSCRRRSTSYC